MDHVKSTTPVARKEHCCFGCRELIMVGEEYNVHVHADEGRIFSTKLCDICDEHCMAHDYEDGIYEGEVPSYMDACGCDECAESLGKINARNVSRETNGGGK